MADDPRKSAGGPPGTFNVREMLSKLTIGQMVALGIIVLAGITLIGSIFYYAQREEMAPLFTARMDSKTHMLVRDELTGRGIEFEVADSGRILVPESQVNQLRIEFEALDLTPESKDAWSILDETNPLQSGQTMMELQKMRALSKDIEQTLEENPEVMRAKVHITPGRDSPFADQTRPATVAVMLKLKKFTQLSKEQVRGMQHFVANAVDSADPGTVTIHDQYNNMLSTPASEDEDIDLSRSNLELKAKMEQNMEQKIIELVESFLGPGKVIAKVNLKMRFDKVESFKREYGGEDAEGEPQTFYETTKKETIRRGAGLGEEVGTGANAAQAGPIPETDVADGGSFIQRDNETEQKLVNETQTTIKQTPWEVERLSIALQLDYKEVETQVREPNFFDKYAKSEPDWITLEEVALSPEEIQQVESMVKGATNFNENRDYLSVVNFPFKPAISKRAQAEMSSGLLIQFIQDWTPTILQIIVFFLFVWIGIGLFRRFVAPILQQAQLEEPALSAALPSGPPKTVAELESELEEEIESSIPSAQLSKSEIMKKRLVEMTQQDPESIAGLVRTWLLEDE